MNEVATELFRSGRYVFRKRVAADTGITDLSNIDKVRRLPSALHR
jgi:hypothetical protein